MYVEELLNLIDLAPDKIEFRQVIDCIDRNYEYSPTAFSNGDLSNSAGENEGSCKIFAFAKLHDLSKAQTLSCFGSYYRRDVLENPNGSNHKNIRNFIETGWRGIEFSKKPPKKKIIAIINL